MPNLGDIAAHINGTLVGDGELEISKLAPFESATTGELSFVLDPKYDNQLDQCNASALITYQQFDTIPNQIIVSDPREALALTISLFEPSPSTDWEISPQAVVHSSSTIDTPVSVGAFSVVGQHCTIGKNTVVHPHVVIGNNCSIGTSCIIHPGVVIYDNTVIGNNVIVHAGNIIGTDGFGYYPKDGKWHKIPQIGRVVIEDDVEIGGSNTIDRGCLGDTRIGARTKIDNLNHVGHNTTIGQDCIITSQIGFSGSTSVGDSVTIGGQAGVAQHATVPSHSTLASRTGVTKTLPATDSPTVFSGFPAQEHSKEQHLQATLRQLAKKHHQESQKD